MNMVPEVSKAIPVGLASPRAPVKVSRVMMLPPVIEVEAGGGGEVEGGGGDGAVKV